MGQRAWFLFLLLEAYCVVSEEVPPTTVEFENIWGIINVRAEDQSPVEITCVASSADPNGKFMWMIGDELLPIIEDKLQQEEGQFKQTYELIPQIEYDKKDLTCKYVVQSESGDVVSEAEDVLNVRVTYAKFPQHAQDAGEYDEGSPVELTVQFGMYPRPEDYDLVWLIEDTDGEEFMIRIGEMDETGMYSARPIESTGNNRFTAVLDIAAASEEEASRRHYLQVRSPHDDDIADDDRKVLVTFSLTKTEEESTPLNPSNLYNVTSGPSYTISSNETTADHDDDEEDEEEEKAMLGIGLFVIIAVVALIVLVCLGFCGYQMCCKKKNDETKGRYQQAATSEGKNLV